MALVNLLLLTALPLLAAAQHASRALQICDTYKACYLRNTRTGREITLTSGANPYRADNLLDDFSIRCDVNGIHEMDLLKFFWDGKKFEEFGAPRWMNGDSLNGTYIVPVDYLKTCGPKQVTVEFHVWSFPCFTKNFTLEACGVELTPPPTRAPVKLPTVAPIAPVKAPIKATSAPVNLPAPIVTMPIGAPILGEPVSKQSAAPVPTPIILPAPTPIVPTAPTPIVPTAPTSIVPTAPTPIAPSVSTPIVPSISTPIVPSVSTPIVPLAPTPIVPSVSTPLTSPSNVSPVQSPVKLPTATDNTPPPVTLGSPTATPTVYSTPTGVAPTITVPTNAPRAMRTAAPRVRRTGAPRVPRTDAPKANCTPSPKAPTPKPTVSAPASVPTTPDTPAIMPASVPLGTPTTPNSTPATPSTPIAVPNSPVSVPLAPIPRIAPTPNASPVVGPPSNGQPSIARVCQGGYKKVSGYCVREWCTSDFKCPVNSKRIRGRECYVSKRDCRCIKGFHTFMGKCRKKLLRIIRRVPIATPTLKPTCAPKVAPAAPRF